MCVSPGFSIDLLELLTSHAACLLSVWSQKFLVLHRDQLDHVMVRPPPPTPRVEPANDRGEPAVSYNWTGWVWEIAGWSNSRLQENYRIILEEFIEYTPIQ